MPASRRRVFLGAVAALLALLAAAQPVLAAATGGWMSARLPLLAVKLGKGGEERGLVIYANVSVGPGAGEVSVLPVGLVDESTVLSTRLAFLLASLLDHRDPYTHSAVVRFETSSEVGGPSASGFIAAAFYLLMRGVVPDTRDYTMTGMVSPGGLVLSVAGVVAKTRAALSKGIENVLVPPPDAGAVARAGGHPVTVCSVEDAAAVLSGARGAAAPSVNETRLLAAVPLPSVFGRDAERFINYTEKLMDLLPAKTRSLEEKLLGLAREALRRGDYYSAASIAFTALLRAANATIALHGLGALEQRLGITIQGAIADAKRILEDRVNRYMGGGECDAWKAFALSAASYRLYLAERLAGSKRPGSEALALLRALSARSWAEAADQLHGPVTSCALLRRAAGFMIDYAELSYRYLVSLVQSPAARIYTAMPDNRTMAAWLRDARAALRSGDTALALGLASYIVSEVEARIAFGNTAARCIQRHWLSLAADAGPLGLVPAALYHRYAALYSDKLAEALNTSKASLITVLESSAEAWSLAALAVEALAASPQTPIQQAAAAAAAQETPLLGVATAAVLASTIAAAAAAAAGASRSWRRWPGPLGGYA